MEGYNGQKQGRKDLESKVLVVQALSMFRKPAKTERRERERQNKESINQWELKPA